MFTPLAPAGCRCNQCIKDGTIRVAECLCHTTREDNDAGIINVLKFQAGEII